jgi:hypothetical protein
MNDMKTYTGFELGFTPTMMIIKSKNDGIRNFGCKIKFEKDYPLAGSLYPAELNDELREWFSLMGVVICDMNHNSFKYKVTFPSEETKMLYILTFEGH